MSVSMQAFYADLFSPRAMREAHWGALARLTRIDRAAFARLDVFWTSW